MPEVPLPEVVRGLLEALVDARPVVDWDPARWDVAIRVARPARLLARLAGAIDRDLGERPPLPPLALEQLRADQRLSRARLTALTWSMDRVGAALAPLGAPCVLLKGAAYVAQRLPIADGRLPSDLDILVPVDHLDAAQRLLQAQGWSTTPMDAYDEHYYRAWSHEVPPMRHQTLEMELDLHHAIVPPVARRPVATAPLLARSVPTGPGPWRVFAWEDQVLHSLVHWVVDSDLRDRLRDAVDLRGLLAGRSAAEAALLGERARELGLVPPLVAAVGLLRALWPDGPAALDADWLRAVLTSAGQRPGPVARADRRLGLQSLRWASLMPLDPRGPGWFRAARKEVAATVLLAAYHRQRMPLALLLPHLWRKWRLAGAQTDVTPGGAG